MLENDGSFVVNDFLVVAITVLIAATSCHYLYAAVRSNKKRQCTDGSIIVAPPHVRSWIPYVGLTIEMGENNLAFILKEYTNKFQTPIFSATILGQKCYFVGDSNHVTMQYKSTKVFDADSVQIEFIHRVLDIPRDQSVEFFKEKRSSSGSCIRFKSIHSLMPILYNEMCKWYRQY
jgi:hypothetical protein